MMMILIVFQESSRCAKGTSFGPRGAYQSRSTNWVQLIQQEGRQPLEKRSINHIMTTTFPSPLPPLDCQTFLRPCLCLFYFKIRLCSK